MLYDTSVVHRRSVGHLADIHREKGWNTYVHVKGEQMNKDLAASGQRELKHSICFCMYVCMYAWAQMLPNAKITSILLYCDALQSIDSNSHQLISSIQGRPGRLACHLDFRHFITTLIL